MQKTELCCGIIKRTAPSGKFYGWVTVYSQPLYEDVFFHFSSLDPSVTSLSVGDECQFNLVHSDKKDTGKGVMAENIKILPKGTLQIANLRPEVYVGVIREELREPKPGEEPIGGLVRVTKWKNPPQRNHGRMAKLGDQFYFSGRDLHKSLIGPQLHQFLRKGDEIEFQLYDCLVPRRVDREIRATRVCLEKLAGARYYGMIDRIPQSRSGSEHDRAFGWIKFAEPGKEEIHFRFDRILSNEHPEVGDEVEFGIEYDHMKRPGASRIMFVPKGTCAEQLETFVCEGVVTDAPRLHVLDGERREGHMDRDVNHFLGGVITFQNPANGVQCVLPCFLKSKFCPQSFYGKTPSPRLLKGDRVAFNLNIYKKDPAKQYISDIEVTVPTFEFRLVGMVSVFSHSPINTYNNKRNRPPKTGIIKVPEPQTPEEVFFHMNECEKPDEIRDQTEVEFDVAYNSKERPVAIRIRKKPKNFLLKQKPLHKDIGSKVRMEQNQPKSKHRKYFVSNEEATGLKSLQIHRYSMDRTSPYDYLENGVEVIFDIYRDLFARQHVVKNVRFKNKDVIRSRKRKVTTRVESNSERFPRPRRKPKYNKARNGDNGMTAENRAVSSESNQRNTGSSMRQKRKGKKGDPTFERTQSSKGSNLKAPKSSESSSKNSQSSTSKSWKSSNLSFKLSKSNDAKAWSKSSPTVKNPKSPSVKSPRPFKAKSPTKAKASDAKASKSPTPKASKPAATRKRTPKKPPLPQNIEKKRNRGNSKTTQKGSTDQKRTSKSDKPKSLNPTRRTYPEPPTMTKSLSEPASGRGGKRRFPKSSRGRSYRRGRGRGRKSHVQRTKSNAKGSPEAPDRPKKQESSKPIKQ